MVNEGRRPGLKIKCHDDDILMVTCAQQLLESMSSIAKTLDQAEEDQRYQNTLNEQQEKIASPELSPSAQVLAKMKKDSASWLSFAGDLSKQHKVSLTQKQYTNSTEFTSSVEQSFQEANQLKLDDTVSFESFMQNYQAE